jgi:putative ABC transport system permease protein
MLLALLVGAAFGALTAVLHLGLRINSLLASILTVTAAFTINLRIQGKSNIPLLGTDSIYTPLLGTVKDTMEAWFGAAGVQNHRNVVTALVAGTLVAIIWVVVARFLRTEVGIGLRATGNNPQMSNAQGIDTRKYLIGGVALSNALVGMSGAMVAQHQGFADVNSGAGLIIAGLAAVIIGEVLFGGRGTSLGRLLVAVSLGMILYRTAIAIALASDVDLPFLEPIQLAATDVRLATAVIVGLLLAIPRAREVRQRRKVRR